MGTALGTSNMFAVVSITNRSPRRRVCQVCSQLLRISPAMALKVHRSQSSDNVLVPPSRQPRPCLFDAAPQCVYHQYDLVYQSQVVILPLRVVVSSSLSSPRVPRLDVLASVCCCGVVVVCGLWCCVFCCVVVRLHQRPRHDLGPY